MDHPNKQTASPDDVPWDDQSESFHEFFGGAGVAAVIYLAIGEIYFLLDAGSPAAAVTSAFIVFPIVCVVAYPLAIAAAAICSLPLFFVNLSLGRTLSSKIYSLLSCGWGLYCAVVLPIFIASIAHGPLEFDVIGSWHLYCVLPIMTLGHTGGYVMRSRWERQMEHDNRLKGYTADYPYSKTRLSFGIKQIMICTIWFALGALVYSFLPPSRWQFLIGFCICEVAALCITYLFIRYVPEKSWSFSAKQLADRNLP